MLLVTTAAEASKDKGLAILLDKCIVDFFDNLCLVNLVSNNAQFYNIIIKTRFACLYVRLPKTFLPHFSAPGLLNENGEPERE